MGGKLIKITVDIYELENKKKIKPKVGSLKGQKFKSLAKLTK